MSAPYPIATELFPLIQHLLVVCLFILCAIPLAMSLYRGKLDIFEPIIIHSVFMFMISTVIFDRLYLRDPFLRYPEWVDWGFPTAFLILSGLHVLFFAMILVGYYIPVERLITILDLSSDGVTLSSEQLKVAAVGYVAVGLLSYLLLVRSALDWNLFLLFTTTRPRSEVFNSAQHFKLGARAIYIGYLVWITGTIVEGRRPGLAHLVVLALVAVLFLLLGGRGNVLLIVSATVLLFYYTHVFPIIDTTSSRFRVIPTRLYRRIKLSSIFVAGGMLGVGTILAGAVRSWQEAGSVFDSRLIVRVLTFGIHNDHLDNLLVALSIIPEKIGYQWGTFVFRVPLNYVPRSLWPNKPVLTVGSLIRRVFLPDGSGGRPPGMVGRLYLDLGIPSVIFGALLFGVILRYLYVLLGENSESPVFLLMYVIILISFMKGISNGSLWILSNHLLLLSPLLLYEWAPKIRSLYDS